ncbi:MAG: hypothetical protein NT015_02100 [Alphaproteobacteria bacterium]|nr:hypothetical protein [Alphaproteobacteria bacterium]
MPIAMLIGWIPSIICAMHVVRTGQQMYWLWILVIGGPLGAALYFFAVMLPDLMGGRTARSVGKVARQTLDPERDYRNALRALDDTPTVGNRIKVAQAAVALGRWSDAEAQWALCGDGHWGDDPVVLLGHADSLLELGQYDAALKKLEKLKALGREGEAPRVVLAFARAYEGLGRNDDADAAYRFAADRVPGLEAGGRYVAFMAKVGRREDAEIGLAEIERRFLKISPPLRGEARPWRDLAAKALGKS